ncbi:MAG: ribbon-helix-helix protein, CopG family [Coprococcus sp.]
MEENIKRRPGRPTEKRKDTILRLRIDSDTHAKLNAYAKKNKQSMSQIMREAIERLIAEDEKELEI